MTIKTKSLLHALLQADNSEHPRASTAVDTEVSSKEVTGNNHSKAMEASKVVILGSNREVTANSPQASKADTVVPLPSRVTLHSKVVVIRRKVGRVTVHPLLPRGIRLSTFNMRSIALVGL